MKRIILLFSIATTLMTGCKKEEIVVYNYQITPDLSNPIIQKLTNITWYRNLNTTQEEWTSLENIPKPSEAMASMLYGIAWVNFTLYRDGTSNMVYVPPVFPYAYIHCRGTWQVSKTEENTLILNTKTPVSNATVKIRVNNLEAKDNVSYINLSMDFGNRLVLVDFDNSIPNVEPEALQAANYDWFASKIILNTALNASDFIGTWSSPYYDRHTFSEENYPSETKLRVTYVEDLLAQTPIFMNGVAFNLEENGKAHIAYNKTTFSQWSFDKNLVSDAKWYVKGNKIMIESDEEFFYSVGEILFGLTVHAPGLQYLGEYEETPIRLQTKRFYAIEVIERKEHGFWCRVTSNDGGFYSFLFKTEFDASNTMNIKELVQ
ncbi:MAG TPA: hypothetical protein PKA53_02960 [Sphingobacterium sp.]|nr:hypothetical protein [Sphingobacterium sp.]